jgi:tRNA(Ile2) C34 agmatinyltransferase TiaS
MNGPVLEPNDPGCPGCGKVAVHDGGDIYRCERADCRVVMFDGECP